MAQKYGTLIIPTLRICVDLYEGEDTQAIVDATDSAAFFRLGVQNCIADHCHQGDFARLAGAIPDRTYAWIIAPEGLEKYVCVRNEIGHLINRHLRDGGMRPVSQQNPGGLCIYTCTGKTKDEATYVYLTYWRPNEK